MRKIRKFKGSRRAKIMTKKNGISDELRPDTLTKSCLLLVYIKYLNLLLFDL
jgi:hypothetical protein